MSRPVSEEGAGVKVPKRQDRFTLLRAIRSSVRMIAVHNEQLERLFDTANEKLLMSYDLYVDCAEVVTAVDDALIQIAYILENWRKGCWRQRLKLYGRKESE